jgi:hypothetical protein
MWGEPFGTKDRGQLWPEHLHSHGTPVPEILSQEYGGHAPAADFSFDPVTVRERSRQAFLIIHSGRSSLRRPKNPIEE